MEGTSPGRLGASRNRSRGGRIRLRAGTCRGSARPTGHDDVGHDSRAADHDRDDLTRPDRAVHVGDGDFASCASSAFVPGTSSPACTPAAAAASVDAAAGPSSSITALGPGSNPGRVVPELPGRFRRDPGGAGREPERRGRDWRHQRYVVGRTHRPATA